MDARHMLIIIQQQLTGQYGFKTTSPLVKNLEAATLKLEMEQTEFANEQAKKEWIEERAAILEFDAGYLRDAAEYQAKIMFQEQYEENRLAEVEEL